MAGKINPAQTKKMWAAAAELWPREDMKEMLYSLVQRLTGSSSISSLTAVGACRVIDELEKFLGRDNAKKFPRRRAAAAPGGPRGATEQQLWKIRGLAEKLGWDDKRLLGFVKKYYRVDKVEWLTYAMAQACTEGLKAMLARQEDGGPKESRKGG
ncbi:regulatory protein GemA [Pelotomaculum propionicicum]|uniref:Regulatory protein GemA n=1 Tax=Pelotomaculum propionicicum TaxID=258475 RepID=A0A4Y7RLG4_9FIRM|nr:regulatory protein GemA [Pelotomaculum propionicicum]TEB09157.1 hypothetical protein Pmgp_03378 [Pelotomaculum propionicicum]